MNLTKNYRYLILKMCLLLSLKAYSSYDLEFVSKIKEIKEIRGIISCHSKITGIVSLSKIDNAFIFLKKMKNHKSLKDLKKTKKACLRELATKVTKNPSNKKDNSFFSKLSFNNYKIFNLNFKLKSNYPKRIDHSSLFLLTYKNNEFYKNIDSFFINNIENYEPFYELKTDISFY